VATRPAGRRCHGHCRPPWGDRRGATRQPDAARGLARARERLGCRAVPARRRRAVSAAIARCTQVPAEFCTPSPSARLHWTRDRGGTQGSRGWRYATTGDGLDKSIPDLPRASRCRRTRSDQGACAAEAFEAKGMRLVFSAPIGERAWRGLWKLDDGHDQCHGPRCSPDDFCRAGTWVDVRSVRPRPEREPGQRFETPPPREAGRRVLGRRQ